MRLPEVERGENFGKRMLIGMISLVSGIRLPDAARVAFYRTEFFGGPLGAWTQAAMRGPSEWSIGERELMAASVAKWNSCAFCTGAHAAVAAKVLGRPIVDRALGGRVDELSPAFRATLTLLEKLTLTPKDVAASDAQSALQAGVTSVALEDAIAVASIFNTVSRYADALDFQVPTVPEFDKAAVMLLKRGYRG